MPAFVPIRDWTIQIGDWWFGAAEYAYPVPEGLEGLRGQTRIFLGPMDFSIPEVTAIQVLGLTGIVALVLIALVAVFVTRRLDRRTG